MLQVYITIEEKNVECMYMCVVYVHTHIYSIMCKLLHKLNIYVTNLQ